MPINVAGFIFQETDYTDYSGARTQWNISGSALNPSAIDVLRRFQDVYPQYDGNMFDAYDYAEGDGVVRYNDGYGYFYWRLIEGNVPISDVIFNGTPLMEFKQGSVVVFKKAIGTFGGLSGASPSSYPSQIVRADLNEQVVNPGSPSKSYYVFDSWYPSLPNAISVNTTFYPQWEEKPVSPTNLTYASKTLTTLIFSIKNSNPYSVRIYYGTSSNPASSYVTVATNTTTSITISGLSPGTSYTCYFRCRSAQSLMYSGQVSSTQTTNTLSAPSTWFDYSKTSNSITMSVYNPNTVSVTLYYAANQNPPSANSITVQAQSYAYATVSGLSANTTYTIYGRFGYSGKYSATVSDSARTNTAGKSWVYVTYTSSDPEIIPEIYSANATTGTAPSILEAAYPAANLTLGSFGTVFSSDGTWIICEVQIA